MCFGGQTTYTPPNNPAPYTANTSQNAVTESTQPANTPLSSGATASLGPQAAAKDAQDTPTAPVNGYSISSGLQTTTL